MIHPTAIIDPSASIADDVHIGAYAIVGADVEIGSGTSVGAHTTIYGPSCIGRDNQISQHALLGGKPQDIDFKDEATQLAIGDRNVIREYVSMNRGTVKGGGLTRVADDNYLMAYVHIGHDSQVGSHNVFTNSTSLAGHVEVGDYCNLGGFTLLHQFIRIGSHAFTSMGAVVNRDVPPFVIVSGNYARSFGINKVGLKRFGFSAAKINAIRKAYKLLVRKPGERETALKQLAPLAEEFSEIKVFMDFVSNSARGIVK